MKQTPAVIKALQQLGVKRVIANYAVGGIAPHIKPLELTTLSDVIDFTTGRAHTFIEGGENGVDHVEMSQPYCPIMSHQLAQRASDFGLTMHTDAVYAAANGPRFETPAEIRMMRTLGASVVGMTGMPEVALAREAGMYFAGVALSLSRSIGRLASSRKSKLFMLAGHHYVPIF